MKNKVIAASIAALLLSAPLPAQAADSFLKKAGIAAGKAVTLPILVVVGAGCGFVVGGVGGALFWHEFNRQEKNVANQKKNTDKLVDAIKAKAVPAEVKQE